MSRDLTPAEARRMAAARKTHAGGPNGRPRIPTRCPKCRRMCKSARAALGHCVR